MPVVAALLGSFLAFLLFDPASPPRNALFSGVLHGILVGVLAVVAVGFGLMFLTQRPDHDPGGLPTPTTSSGACKKPTWKQLEKEAASEKISEEEREKLQKEIESHRSQTAEQDAHVREDEKGSRQIRSYVVDRFFSSTTWWPRPWLACWAACSVKKLFRSRFQPWPGASGGGPGEGDASGAGQRRGAHEAARATPGLVGEEVGHTLDRHRNRHRYRHRGRNRNRYRKVLSLET